MHEMNSNATPAETWIKIVHQLFSVIKSQGIIQNIRGQHKKEKQTWT